MYFQDQRGLAVNGLFIVGESSLVCGADFVENRPRGFQNVRYTKSSSDLYEFPA